MMRPVIVLILLIVMTLHPIDPNKDATYEITLGSTFDDAPRQTFHALKYNFKPAAIDYSLPGNLTSSEDGTGEVSVELPSTTDGEYHIFKGAMQETKPNEFVLVYDPEAQTFVLERLSSVSRLSATRSSRTNTINGSVSTPNPSYTVDRPIESSRPRSWSNEDIPTISLDSVPTSNTIEDVPSDPEEPIVPVLVTPRLPPVSPEQLRRQQDDEVESSDDDSDIDIGIAKTPQGPKKYDQDDDVSDEDLDDLANELESSLENRPDSSSDADSSDISRPPKPKAPDFNNVPRSGGPISMSRFAGGRRREEEESSSSDDDDD